MDYEKMELEQLIESQRSDAAIGEVQYPEFPGRLVVSIHIENFDPAQPNTLVAWATTDTTIQTYALKTFQDLRFGYSHGEMDGAYQEYLRKKRRPRRLEAYAKDVNGVRTRNRERNREYYRQIQADPEKHAAYLAKRREQAARRRERAKDA